MSAQADLELDRQDAGLPTQHPVTEAERKLVDTYRWGHFSPNPVTAWATLWRKLGPRAPFVCAQFFFPGAARPVTLTEALASVPTSDLLAILDQRSCA